MTEEATEAFRALRVRLLHAKGDRNIKSVIVTSSLAGEGKTSVTANLAVTLALAGHRVVIVAADLRRPRLQTYFQGAGGDGLSEVLTGTGSLRSRSRPLTQRICGLCMPGGRPSSWTHRSTSGRNR